MKFRIGDIVKYIDPHCSFYSELALIIRIKYNNEPNCYLIRLLNSEVEGACRDYSLKLIHRYIKWNEESL